MKISDELETYRTKNGYFFPYMAKMVNYMALHEKQPITWQNHVTWQKGEHWICIFWIDFPIGSCYSVLQYAPPALEHSRPVTVLVVFTSSSICLATSFFLLPVPTTSPVCLTTSSYTCQVNHQLCNPRNQLLYLQYSPGAILPLLYL